jgi:hypothetical protein
MHNWYIQHLHLLFAFKELNISKSILKLQIRQQDKTFNDENLVLALFIYTL